MLRLVIALSMLLSTEASFAGTKWYRGNTGDWLMAYDISSPINEAPVDWSEYEKDFNRWRSSWGGVKDGKASSLKKAVESSPGCVLVQGAGDHVKVFRLKYKNPGNRDRIAVKGLMVTTFSDNTKNSADGNRKTAQRSVMFYCGAISGAHGIAVPN